MFLSYNLARLHQDAVAEWGEGVLYLKRLQNTALPLCGHPLPCWFVLLNIGRTLVCLTYDEHATRLETRMNCHIA